MRLNDLEPRWLSLNGKRVGFIFRSPTKREYFQTCFAQNTPHREQRRAVRELLGTEDLSVVQLCKNECAWTITGDDFGSLSVMPSLDGSAGGLWHGFVTNGEIVGGL